MKRLRTVQDNNAAILKQTWSDVLDGASVWQNDELYLHSQGFQWWSRDGSWFLQGIRPCDDRAERKRRERKGWREGEALWGKETEKGWNSERKGVRESVGQWEDKREGGEEERRQKVEGYGREGWEDEGYYWREMNGEEGWGEDKDRTLRVRHIRLSRSRFSD